MKYVEILSEDDIILLQCQSIILAESNSHQLYEVKLIKQIKDILSQKFKGSISKLKEILSQAKIKIKDFISFIAKNIKKIKNIRIINVEQTKDYFSDVIKRILEKPEFKNESKKLSLSSILFEGDTHIEQIVNNVSSPKIKVDLEKIKADEVKLNKFQEDIKKAAKEDKKFNFANNLMRTIKNYEKPVNFLLAITMVATVASSAISFGGPASPKQGEEQGQKIEKIVFVNGGNQDVSQANPAVFTTDFSGVNFDGKAESPIKINLDRYKYFNAQSESEFLKFILTKEPSQFMKRSHVDKLMKIVSEVKEKNAEIHEIDNITYMFAKGSLWNVRDITDFVFEHVIWDDLDSAPDGGYDLKEKKHLSKVWGGTIIESFESDDSTAFVLKRLFGNKQIVFIDLNALSLKVKENTRENNPKVFKELTATLEHELGHIKSELKAEPLNVLGLLSQEDEFDFYGFATRMMDKAFSDLESYRDIYVTKSYLKYVEELYGKESWSYKNALNKKSNYKKNFTKVLNKLTKEDQNKVLDHIFISLKASIASNLITVTDESGKEIININKDNLENIIIKPISNSVLETASQLLINNADADAKGYFFDEEERSENITDSLKHIEPKDLKSFVKKFIDSNFIEDAIKNKKNITMKDMNVYFANLGFDQDEIWRLMSCSGFGPKKNKKGEIYFVPMSSLGNDYELMHQRFWRNSKAMIQKNSIEIDKHRKGHDHDHDHHDHDHKHESFARLKEKVYNKILSETYNIYT